MGGGPIHVCWVFKPGSESLPDLRLGFICTPEENESDLSEFSLNESIARAVINLIDKLILVVPSETITKRISDSMPDRSILQLRKYVDLVCKISVHPSLPPINCGFIVLSEERDTKDYEDNQFSIRKIEEAMMRGIRSGLDKVYLIASNKEIAKSVSRKIEWLSSFGSLFEIRCYFSWNVSNTTNASSNHS